MQNTCELQIQNKMEAVSLEKEKINVYTSYFDNIPEIGDGYEFKSVANRPPNDFNRETLYRLAPDMNLVNRLKDGDISTFEFEYRYKQALDYLEREENYFEGLIEEFRKEGKPIVLVCHEPTGEWCHRHLLKPYLERAGAIVSEYVTIDDLILE